MAAIVQPMPGLPVTTTSQELRLDKYDSNAFAALPALPSAASRFKALGAEALVASEFRSLFLEHEMDRTYGLILLHRHFDLKSSERLVEYRGTSVPWQHDELDGKVVPSTWLICQDGAIRPYEFAYAPQLEVADSDPNPKSPGKVRFLQSFQHLLQKHNAAGLFGLCRYPGDDFEGRIEITRGRANINLLPKDVSTKHLNRPFCETDKKIQMIPEATDRAAAWFFSPPLWELKCICKCKSSDDDHEHGGHVDVT
jgi:hypothetical protein